MPHQVSVHELFVELVQILKILLWNSQNNLPVIIPFAGFVKFLKLSDFLVKLLDYLKHFLVFHRLCIHENCVLGFLCKVVDFTVQLRNEFLQRLLELFILRLGGTLYVLNDVRKSVNLQNSFTVVA